MSELAKMGGVVGGRELDSDDPFEMMVHRRFKDLILEDRRVGEKIWASLANTAFKHTSGVVAAYSFRAAGDLVAAVAGRGDYSEWYCCHPYPYKGDDILNVFAEEGWTVYPEFYE